MRRFAPIALAAGLIASVALAAAVRKVDIITLFKPGVIIGNTGTLITNSYAASATIDFASKTDLCVDSSSITVTGAAAGDVCVVGTPSTVDTNAWYICYVDAANSVKVKFCSHGATDPASGTFKVRTFAP